MNKPDISPKHKWSDYWRPVESGLREPDEWQRAIMDKVQEALDAGLFYTTDVHKYVMEHNDFIPAEWWSYQYSGTPVEGGIMGMELYMARSTLDKMKERAADDEVLKTIEVGKVLGTLCVNGGKTTKCVIKAIDGRRVTFSCKRGSYDASFAAQARAIPVMIERAVSRGWRKS